MPLSITVCMLFLCVEDVSQMRLKLQCKTEFLNNSKKKIIFCCVYINSGLAGFCIWYFMKRRVQRGVREEDNHIAPSRLGYCLLYIQQERSLRKIYWFDFFSLIFFFWIVWLPKEMYLLFIVVWIEISEKIIRFIEDNSDSTLILFIFLNIFSCYFIIALRPSTHYNN